MSLHPLLDWSIKHQLATRTIAAGRRISLAPLLPTLQSRERSDVHKHGPIALQTLQKEATELLESQLKETFFEALADAGRCSVHKINWQARQSLKSRRPLQKSCSQSLSQRRGFRTAVDHPKHARAAAYNVTRDELHSLIPLYKYELDNAIDATSWQERSDHSADASETPSSSTALRRRPYRRIVNRLAVLLEDPNTPHDQLMAVYNELPSPGAKHAPPWVIGLLLHTLSVQEHKSETTMNRYLSVLNDARAAGLPIKRSQWSAAISFVGRWSKHVTGDHVDAALQIWKEMELDAKVPANEVTFNTLFDIAVKANKFVLADMIYKEMQHRGLKLDRYFRTSLIYYHGLRRSGADVRQAYRDLVDAGEVVDTVVINCVISAMLSSGEPYAAEQVFERAKRLHAAKSGAKLPSATWQQRRELGRILKAAVLDSPDGNGEDSAERQRLQDMAPLAPTSATYLLLIKYYAVVSGDIDRAAALLSEMHELDLVVPGALFLYLFKGFAVHGGVLYTSWTRRRLESAFTALIAAVDASKPSSRHAASSYHFSPSMTTLCLAAFLKCADVERAREVHATILPRWRVDVDGPMPLLEDMVHLPPAALEDI